MKIQLLLLSLLLISGSAFTADDSLRKPFFQGDFFGEMPRVFCTIQEVDLKEKALVIKVDSDGRIARVPIGPDTELMFRDSYGELDDFFPGQHVMLFMYVDEDRNWTGTRAVQDDIQMTASHKWFAVVTKIDRDQRTYWTRREERNARNEITQVIEANHVYLPEVKVWKGEKPSGIDALQVGDEVIQQLVEKDGKRVAVEILDRKGDEAVRKMQETRFYQIQTERGLSGYVSDLEPLTGALAVVINRSGVQRAGELKVGDELTIVPSDGSRPFGAAVHEIQGLDTRKRLQLVTNSRVVGRLKYGQQLRVFMPGTGQPVPTGRSGVPSPPVKK